MNNVPSDNVRHNQRLRWIKAPAAPPAYLSELPRDISPLIGQLLWNRGITDPAQVGAFLEADYSHLHDPRQLLGMDQAVARIKQARDTAQRIAVYGDFDTDGVTGVTLLYQALTGIGLDVLPYILKRIEEAGWGWHRLQARASARERWPQVRVSRTPIARYRRPGDRNRYGSFGRREPCAGEIWP